LQPLVYRIRSSFFILAFLIATLFPISGYAQQNKYHFSASKMGSPFNLVLWTNDSSSAQNHADACFQLIDSLNHIFSNYDSTSELSYINQQAGMQSTLVSPLMWELLQLSKKAFYGSKGAFNIAMGPITSLWRNARHEKIFPTVASVKKQLKLCHFKDIQWDSIHHSIYLPFKGMQLDVGGIGKGYIAQKVVTFLQSRGVKCALADAGGDIVMSQVPPYQKGWKVGINIPEKSDDLLPQALIIHNKSVATSGDVYQFIEHKGVKYSHIIDPQTGYGVTSLRNVTVIANDGATADWLATACSILPLQEAKLVASAQQAELLITFMKQGKLKRKSTKGFDAYFK